MRHAPQNQIHFQNTGPKATAPILRKEPAAVAANPFRAAGVAHAGTCESSPVESYVTPPGPSPLLPGGLPRQSQAPATENLPRDATVRDRDHKPTMRSGRALQYRLKSRDAVFPFDFFPG